MMTLSPLELTGLILIAFNELGILCSPFIHRLFPKSEKKKAPKASELNRIAAVVCAHNEESTIGNLLTLLKQQTRPADAIIVIADNCSDNTAAIAENMGAVVLEKEQTPAGGKADALKFFLENIRDKDFDGFVFFDADTIPDAAFMEHIISGLQKAEVAVGCHSFENISAAWAEAGNSMLGHVMWHHYLEPRYKRGVHSLVMGMGYGLRRSCLEQQPWTPRTRTEDLALSLDISLTDTEFVLCPQAVFRDKQPETWLVSFHRMRRWMTGDLQCLQFYFFPLLKQIFHGNWIKTDFLFFLFSVPTLILKAFGVLCLAAAACFGEWQMLALILGFDFAISGYAVLSRRKRLCLQSFSIPALFCFYQQLPWIAFSVLFFPPKCWIPGRQAPCSCLKKTPHDPAIMQKEM